MRLWDVQPGDHYNTSHLSRPEWFPVRDPLYYNPNYQSAIKSQRRCGRGKKAGMRGLMVSGLACCAGHVCSRCFCSNVWWLQRKGRTATSPSDCLHKSVGCSYKTDQCMNVSAWGRVMMWLKMWQNKEAWAEKREEMDEGGSGNMDTRKGRLASQREILWRWNPCSQYIFLSLIKSRRKSSRTVGVGLLLWGKPFGQQNSGLMMGTNTKSNTATYLAFWASPSG